MGIWIERRTDANLALMSKTLGVSETLALLLANRGVRSKNAAIRYLKPNLRFMGDIHLMKDMENACELIRLAAERGDKVVVYGDYDVDGVMGTSILMKALRDHGADVSLYIPKREEEGYGLNMAAVQKLCEEGADLLITCDNGAAALDEINEARRLGLKVVVLDHHELGFFIDEDGNRRDKAPSADMLIDPKQQACNYPFKQFCAAGLAYLLAESLYRLSGMNFARREEFLALAAIATICDIVPLLGENRILAAAGLNAINQNKRVNLGLWFLCREKNLLDKTLGVFDIGFLLGPCVNASGRLAHAADAARLFITDDEEEASRLAADLARLNEERKKMTAQAVERVINGLDKTPDKVLVLYDEVVHESIAGIVAGRIKEMFSRPVIMLTKGAEHVKGSARSIENYNIFEELFLNRDLFIRFGGHAMAAGLTLAEENIDVLRKRLNENCRLTDEDCKGVFYIDKRIQPEHATFRLAQEINLLAPFGKDNPEPLFEARGLRPEQIRMIDDKNTMIFTFAVAETSRKIKAVCFGLNDKWKEDMRRLFDDYECGKIFAGVLRTACFRMDVVYALEINEYNNNYSVQMRLKDFQIYHNEVE